VKITITGRGIEVQDATRDYAQEKARKLERFDDQLQKVEIVMAAQGDGKLVEMKAVSRRGQPVIGTSEHEDLYAAIDGVIDKVVGQLSKANKKRKDRRKRSERVPPPPEPSDLVEDEVLDTYEDVVEEFSEKLD